MKITEIFARMQAKSKGAGYDNPKTGERHTTPWAWRTNDGIYVGWDGSVWMYRALDTKPWAWVDGRDRLAAGKELADLLADVSGTAPQHPLPNQLVNTNREIHLQVITWNTVAQPAEGIPEPLAQYQEAALEHIDAPRRVLVLGVRLRVGASTGKKLTDQIQGLALQLLGEDTPNLDAYRNDIRIISSILGRYGARVPTREELHQMEAWYNYGESPEAVIVEQWDHLVVDTLDRIELAAVGEFHQPILHAPADTWLLDVLSHPQGPFVTSIRAFLQPPTEARRRGRRAQRWAIDQEEQEVATGDVVERQEISSVYELAKYVDDYFSDSRYPLLANTSVVFGRRSSDAHDTYIDYLRATYDIEVVPLLGRQLAALDETLPCSTKRVNPYPQDLSVEMVAYAGVNAWSKLGDNTGALLGLTIEDAVPVFLDPLGAPKANQPATMAVFGDSGSGKAQPLDARILTPDGWTTMGEVNVGDVVIGADGLGHTILGYHPQGVKRAFRVRFSDGSSTVTCDEHLWTVRDHMAYGGRWETRLLSQLSGRNADGTAPLWEIPTVEPVQHQSKDVDVDPYLVGLACMLAGTGVREGDDQAPFGGPLSEVVSEALAGRSIENLDIRSEEGHLPDSYRFGSVEQRRQLLGGIIDAAGVVHPGRIEVVAPTDELAEDICEVARSLGWYARRDAASDGAVTLHLVANGTPELRRRDLIEDWDAHRPSVHPARMLVGVEEVDAVEMACITVDSPGGLYVTDDHIVTHNTFTLQMLALQATLSGLPVVMINPKGYEGGTLRPFAELAGGHVIPLSRIEAAGGYFDPFTFTEPEIAAEIAATHILSVLTGFTQQQEIALEAGLARGASEGARCVGEALAYVDDADVRSQVLDSAAANARFGMAIAVEPREGPGLGRDGLTLIEFDRDLGLPKTLKTSYTRSERVALAAMRHIIRAALEVSAGGGGGVVIIDEAWTLLAQPEGRAALEAVGREGRSLNVLPILATQRIADVIERELEGLLSRVVTLSLREPKEAAAALRLCGLEPTEARIAWLASCGPRREGDTIRPAQAIHRDLTGSRGVIVVGPVPDRAKAAFETNPDLRGRRDSESATSEGPTEDDPELSESPQT